MSKGEEYSWVPFDFNQNDCSDLPSGAVVAGYDADRPAYVARIKKDEHYEFGELRSWAGFAFGYWGNEYEESCGDVLVAGSKQEQVWIDSSNGKQIDGMVSSNAPHEGKQSIGRVWHDNRWISGKVVHHCHCMYFSVKGREKQAHDYQLLSSEYYSWVPLDLTGKEELADIPPRAVIGGHENGCPVYVARIRKDDYYEIGKLDYRGCFSFGYYGKELKESCGEVLVSNRKHGDCWLHSSVGKHPDGSVTEGKESVGRVWLGDRWTPGKVIHGWNRMYYTVNGREESTQHYQILTYDAAFVTSPIGPDAQNAGLADLPDNGRRQDAPQLLCLTLTGDAVRSLLDSDDVPSQDMFMVTKLASGERPWTAVRDLVVEAARVGRDSLSANVTDQLQPMLPMIEQLAIAEG